MYLQYVCQFYYFNKYNDLYDAPLVMQ